MAISSHESARMQTDNWLTPPEIIEALGPFDLDPCACSEPRPWPTAKRHICRPDDGLAAEWSGRVWLNPPYSREAGKWLDKLAAHGEGTALTFARTETKWFQETAWGAAKAIFFLDGRIRFYRPDGTQAKANAGAPSCLIAYGWRDAERLATCGLSGSLIASWEIWNV